jgi:hypothetical protein
LAQSDPADERVNARVLMLAVGTDDIAAIEAARKG